MKQLLKILPKDTKKLYATIFLASCVIMFLIAYVLSGDLIFSLAFSIGLSLIIYIWSIFDEIFGQKRHYKIIESKGFQALISHGFTIEEKNQYKGLTGMFEGYIVDVYYDWSTIVRPKIYKAVIFNVYFLPPLLPDGTTDSSEMMALAEKYDISSWSFKQYTYSWRDGNIIMKNGVGIFNPSSKKIFNRLRLAIDILKSEGLKPADRKTLLEWRKADPFNNIPEIEIYYEEQ